ncbi:MAG: energy-coupling factor transporter transmembrane component T [Bacteroidales bacterium]|jgi:cobalt/nickel transport system permease protein
MENKIPSYLLQPSDTRRKLKQAKRIRLSFLDRTIFNSAKAVRSVYSQAENASRENLIQKINPYVKLFSLLYFVIVISFVNNTIGQICITAFILILFIMARSGIAQVYGRIFFLAFIFGFLAVLPASLNIVTPGKILLEIVRFDRPLHFWIYNIPRDIGFTDNGFRVVSLIFLRVLNSVAFSMFIIFTTSLPSFIKSLRVVGVPDAFLMIISLAYKYIFILSRTIEETYFALRSRLSGNIRNNKIRRIVGGRIFFIFKRSMIIYEETYFAMVSRGYQGKVMLHSRTSFIARDFIALLIIVAFGVCILLI